jgi:ribosomal protein S8
MGTFSYNPATTTGRIRLLIQDREQNEASFSDEEIAAFLDMAGNSIKEAAAVAVTAWTVSQAKIARVIKEEGFTNERDAVDKLLALAAAIRKMDIGVTAGSLNSRIATSQNDNDGGVAKNIRPMGNRKQDHLEDREC